MKSILVRSVVALGVIAGCLLSVPRLHAAGLPNVEDVLDREAKVMADEADYAKLKTVVVKGKISVQGMEGRFAEYRAPSKQYMELTIDGLMTMESGVCNDVAWEKSSITGSRLLANGEKTKALREAGLPGGAGWRKNYKQVKIVGEEPVAGKPAYKVELTTPEGQLMISHFDKASGFLVRQESTMTTAQSKSTLVMFFSDYRKMDGIVYPFKIKVVTGPTEIFMTVDRVEQNVDIPEARFALPAEVNKLVAKLKK